ncbi:MAG: hypothetical protein ACI8TQ_001196 [Planctomycetota bacterium]|jgi:hypothetical protein
MKLRNLFLPSIALGAAILLSTPEPSEGFSTLGFSLSTGQSDFRIHNNFLDAQSNNNTNPHLQFPGYTGAVMALWKGAIEWGSSLHGNGSGDQSQLMDLGSGGSSFDPIFVGEAPGVGGLNDNISSALDQDSGGTLAFVEGASSNGWRMRFLDTNWNWADGPGNFITGIDLQGVACHEYGHSFGLGHSTAGGNPVMGGSISGNGVSDRSLSSDDIAGIQSVYGLANSSGTKPMITQAVNLGGQIQIFGSNFTLNNNEVWFSRLTPGTTSGGGLPIKITGVSSTNGNTEILIAIPATAGAGDIMVKRSSSGQESTSMAFPFNPFSTPPPTPVVSSVVPSQVPPLTATGGATVVITGSGLGSATNLFVNDKQVGDNNTSFSGDWTVDSDTQITFTMPLTGSVGVVDIEFGTLGGPVSTQIEIVAPTSPVLAVGSPILVQADGLSIATSSQDLDFVLLEFSVFDGPTTIPGIFDLEIGAGNFNNIKKAKTWSIGPKLSRKLDSGPITGLPAGLEIFFEGLVLEAANLYDIPYNSTNKVMVTVQ